MGRACEASQDVLRGPVSTELAKAAEAPGGFAWCVACGSADASLALL